MNLKHIFLIGLGLILGLLLVRFGTVALAAVAWPLLQLGLKFALPLVGVYLGVKFLRAKLRQLDDNQARPRQARPRQAEEIDICPKCGEAMLGHHRCRPSDR